MNVFTNVQILIHRYNTGNFMVEKDSGKKVSKSGNAQIKKAEFLTAGKAFKDIF